MTRFVSLRVPLAGPARDHHDPALTILATGTGPAGGLVLSQVVLSLGIPVRSARNRRTRKRPPARSDSRVMPMPVALRNQDPRRSRSARNDVTNARSR